MPQLPTDTEVRAAMDAVIADAARTGRAPTVAEVERRLGIRHATFYRHFRSLIIEHFRPKIPPISAPAKPATAEANDGKTITRLRQENTELRKLLNIYAETIRQLTTDNSDLKSQLQRSSGIVHLDTRRPPSHL
ncbi:hypothetical protein [Kitasatospora sp. NRRL B-11411]|uniref:hypothetical protein n=1 Tax=Kitasatospora sp. NRRL B-11411 TaxID=1463822 RepID=UPI0004C2C1F3|nr:hypothetical protein [Kitasatospora sp. NRRL B-11411]